MTEITQGDILKLENISVPIYVVSKSFFNSSGGIIGCPIVKNSEKTATHFPINLDNIKGYVLSEQVRFFDIKIRGYKFVARSNLNTMTEIVDTVQGFFDFS
ncbi:MAG: type II toxin-antitoxin system PemK/MazF family toxin [Lachnospiraceae bacterium]|nr:type II toxin-antitoxin system PemK/MazF family toxin [Lachnospiraceae bacterium]